MGTTFGNNKTVEKRQRMPCQDEGKMSITLEAASIVDVTTTVYAGPDCVVTTAVAASLGQETVVEIMEQGRPLHSRRTSTVRLKYCPEGIL